MITRKPRKGDQIDYMVNFSDTCNHKEAPPQWAPKGTVEKVEGNICYVAGDSFIWKFSDNTLNRAHRITNQERHAARITFADGNTITTEINGTEEEIRQYYLGNQFNFGDRDWGDPDNMQTATSVEFLG